MKKKIIITGGLGYLGTELCRLYSGISWKHDIIVIDNRFLSERINELKNWNIKFIQGAILEDRKSTRLNSSHVSESRMTSSA